MTFIVLATNTLSTSAVVTSQSGLDHPHDHEGWKTIGPEKACKHKEDGDHCEYALHALEENYLFSYTHDQQLKKSIKKVFEERGFHEDDWRRMLVLKSSQGKVLDLNFLHSPDIFDGPVTPNDFPVKVFLKETWQGKCRKDKCVASRTLLHHACEGKEDGDKCTYKSLQMERKNIKDVLPYNFEGKCHYDDCSSCELNSEREYQVEACLGKAPGKTCEYMAKHTMYKGLCVGGYKGQVLWCKGIKTAHTAACEGKMRKDKCKVEGKMPFEGWCGFSDTALECMNDKTAPSPSGPSPGAPAPPAEDSACASMQKDVTAMKAQLSKIGVKMGLSAPEPEKASRRRGGSRRRRRKA